MENNNQQITPATNQNVVPASNPFEQVLFENETFATLYNQIMGKLGVVEGVNMDMFTAIQQKILSRDPISTETLLILGPIAREYITEARMLVEAYIKLMQTMGSISKQNNIGIITPNVNVVGNPQLQHLDKIDPLASSYKKELDKNKEVKSVEVTVNDPSTEENESKIKIIHSPSFNKENKT